MYYGTPPIVTNGLVLNLDPANSLSIPVDPTVNLIGSNPIPVNNTSSYEFVLASNITGSYNAASQSIEFNILDAPSGWVVNNTSLNTTVLDTSSLYTISFEWKIEPDSTSLCRIWPQITTGNNLTSSFSGVIRNSGSATYTANNTLLPDGFYKYVATFLPSHPGVNGNRSFRFLGGGVSGGQTLRMHWRKLQLERVPYATTFVSGSRNSWGSVPTATYSASLLNTAITGGLPYFNSPTDRALNFDGTGSYAVIPNDNNLIFGTGSFTVSMWIKTPIASRGEGSPSQWGPIISKGCTTSAPAGSWWFAQNSTNNNRVTFNASATASGTFVCALTTPILVDGWHNVVVTRVGITTYLYTDGILTSTDTSSDTDLFNTSSLCIGTNTLNSPKFTQMALSNVNLYNRALTQAEITQNYNAYKSRYGLT